MRLSLHLIICLSGGNHKSKVLIFEFTCPRSNWIILQRPISVFLLASLSWSWWCVCMCRCLFMWVSIYVWTSVCGGQKTTIDVIFLRNHSPRSAFGLHTCAHTHVLNLHYAYTYHNAPICPTLLANEETKIITTALCHILGTVPTAHTRLTHISRLHWEVTETHISS